MHQAHDQQHFLVSDYLGWPDELRCELIDGVVYDMSPAPTLEHQEAIGALFAELRAAFKNRGGGDGPPDCRLFVAPVDVILFEDSVVQPDIAVVCDPAKLADHRFIQGAPDLVVEVLSPSTAAKDLKQKRELYQRAGIPEYLAVHPIDHVAHYYRLDGEGRYGEPAIWSGTDELRLKLLPEFTPTFGELLEWPSEKPNLVIPPA